jgi:DNA-binding ferritin-like protein (Dps family)
MVECRTGRHGETQRWFQMFIERRLKLPQTYRINYSQIKTHFTDIPKYIKLTPIIVMTAIGAYKTGRFSRLKRI